MIETTRSADLTVKDVLNGLESMERWTHELREALATLDHEQRLEVKPRLAIKNPPIVSGGLCPPPPPLTPRPGPRRKKTATKPTTKKKTTKK